MKYHKFSAKQALLLNWWCSGRHMRHEAIICDGAVRSGKSMCMSLSFVLWAFYRFDGADLGLCGKTILSLKRNVVAPLTATLRAMGFEVKLQSSKNYMDIAGEGRKNRFYFFGGRDESSGALIQGITLSGVLFDEVALMPRSFVEQALARCSVEGSKFWFNCNPEHPSHWFYTEWIKKSKDKNALYLHFTMDDNPSLSETMKERYRSLYSGTFYERFILGKWTAAHGAVYPMFGPECIAVPRGTPEKYYISADYGTGNPASFGLWGLYGGVWYRADEYYYSSKRAGAQKTDLDYIADIEALVGSLPIEAVICDPSAASFIAELRRGGKFRVIAADNDVADGIRRVSSALKNGSIKIAPHCRDAIREFSLYRWEDGGGQDRVKKEYDHAMDDIRYFVSTVLAKSEPDDFFVCALSR